jgi:lipoate-protein ligase A
MALDQALLDDMTEPRRSAYIRTYGWSVPTLSLGYFQRLEEARAEDRWGAVPLVRRATGGGAIWHEHELTYAVALSAAHPLAGQNTRLYRAVHAAIAEVLRERGLDLTRRADRMADGNDAVSRVRRPFLCFSDRDPEDLVCGEFKVVGSAQRRRAGAILQHGSILLQGGARTPEHRGVCDFLPLPSDAEAWSEAVSARIAQALGLAAEPRDLPPELRRRGQEIEHAVYRRESWTSKR